MKKVLALLGLASLYLFGLLGHAEEKKPHVALKQRSTKPVAF